MKTKTWFTILGCAVAVALVTAASAAVSLTTSDIVKLTKAGVSDDVIIQTMQSSGSVFQLTPQDVETLKASGVSDRVIKAMGGKAPAPVSPPRPIVSSDAVVQEPSGRSYVGGVSEPVVRALPPDPPPVYYYTAPPTVTYYSYPSYPYYYAPAPYYYCGPRVGFYFGYGGGRHHHWR